MAYLYREGAWCAPGREPKTTLKGVKRPRAVFTLRGQNESEGDPGFVELVYFELDVVAVQQLKLLLTEAERQLLAAALAPDPIAEAERQLELAPPEVFGWQDPPRVGVRS